MFPVILAQLCQVPGHHHSRVQDLGADPLLSDSTTTAEQVYEREPTTRRNPVFDLELWTPMRRQSVQNPHIVESATQCNGRICVWLVNQAMVGVAA